GSNYGADTFIAAPGVSIPTTEPGGAYITITGTSASSAMVAGVAAFERAADPAASNAVIVGRLAQDADPAGTSQQTGNGRVNMQRLVADTSSVSAIPTGVPGGGPLIGPYTAATNCSSLTFSPTSLTTAYNALSGVVAITGTTNCNVQLTSSNDSMSSYTGFFYGATSSTCGAQLSQNFQQPATLQLSSGGTHVGYFCYLDTIVGSATITGKSG